MRKSLIYFFILSLLVSNSFAQKKEDETQIKAVIDSFFQVFSQMDTRYLAYCAPEFELYDMGLVWNNDSIRAYTQKYPKAERLNAFEFIKFNFRGNVAWVSYWNTAKVKYNDKVNTIRWLESAILEKRKKKWILLQMHSTLKNK